MAADTKQTARRVEEELLGRLGLDRGANPLAIETARDAIVGFLSSAPAPLRTWADREVARTDEAYALLSDPTADLASMARLATGPSRGPGAATDTSSPVVASVATRPVRRGILSGLGPVARAVVGGIGVVALVGVIYGVYAIGQPAVPGISGSPAPEASAAASSALDQAQVATLMQRIQADPADVAAYRELTDAYFVAQDYAGALIFAEKLTALDTTSATGFIALGAAYYNTGEIDKAETAWKQAVALDPKNTEAYYDLGYLYLTKTPADDAAARAAWQKVIEIDPDSQAAQTVKTHLDSLLDASAGSATTGS